MYTYNQKNKNSIRHKILREAVEALTVYRESSCCVPKTYVRNVVDYFLSQDEEEQSYKETKSIEPRYINDWEALHSSVIGSKKPSDLCVCYLSGEQPENDFNELINLGVLPQNIWAFENDKSVYKEALKSYNSSEFPQPKIVKMNVEQFFVHSPKKFDIVYVDACGSIAGEQKALRAATTLFQYQRLNSPGVLITNFASPDINNESDLNKYTNLIALYSLLKKYPDTKIDENHMIEGLNEFSSYVKTNFIDSYSEFITGLLSDIPSIIVPLQRLESISVRSNLFNSDKLNKLTVDEINELNHNTICKWLLLLQYIDVDSGFDVSKIQNELTGINGDWDKLIQGVRLFANLKKDSTIIKEDIREVSEYFKNSNDIYRFLDKQTSSLFYDVVINQLTYPLHINVEASKRYNYCAKSTEMFTDVTIFDECRYIYEWLPAIHQIQNAMMNKSWQYIFRFALDGLVKQRLNYNNEFFFQGSVVPKEEAGFLSKTRSTRERIG